MENQAKILLNNINLLFETHSDKKFKKKTIKEIIIKTYDFNWKSKGFLSKERNSTIALQIALEIIQYAENLYKNIKDFKLESVVIQKDKEFIMPVIYELANMGFV